MVVKNILLLKIVLIRLFTSLIVLIKKKIEVLIYNTKIYLLASFQYLHVTF